MSTGGARVYVIDSVHDLEVIYTTISKWCRELFPLSEALWPFIYSRVACVLYTLCFSYLSCCFLFPVKSPSSKYQDVRMVDSIPVLVKNRMSKKHHMCFVTLYEYYLCLYYIDVKTEAQKNEGSLHSSLISKSKLFWWRRRLNSLFNIFLIILFYLFTYFFFSFFLAVLLSVGFWFPGKRSNLCSLQLKHGVLPTGPPGKFFDSFSISPTEQNVYLYSQKFSINDRK